MNCWSATSWLAIGNPFGVGQDPLPTEIISAAGRERKVGITDYQFFIQTDARDQSGQFGRPHWWT